MSFCMLPVVESAPFCVFLQVKNLIVYVEKKVLDDPAISGDENFGAITKRFCTFREGLNTDVQVELNDLMNDLTRTG